MSNYSGKKNPNILYLRAVVSVFADDSLLALSDFCPHTQQGTQTLSKSRVIS